MAPFVITIDGQPVPWERATPVMVGDFPILKTPKRTRAYQDVIKQLAGIAMRRRPPMTGPLRMTVTASLRRPKTVLDRALPWKRGRDAGDVDNYSKTAQDALNGIAFIDDSQICELSVCKVYGKPSLTIRIECIAEPVEAERTAA